MLHVERDFVDGTEVTDSFFQRGEGQREKYRENLKHVPVWSLRWGSISEF